MTEAETFLLCQLRKAMAELAAERKSAVKLRMRNRRWRAETAQTKRRVRLLTAQRDRWKQEYQVLRWGAKHG